MDAMCVALFGICDHNGVAAGLSVDRSSVIVEVGVFFEVFGTPECLEPEPEHVERRHAGGEQADEPDEFITRDISLVKNPASGGMPEIAKTPIVIVQKVMGMRLRRPPILRISCSPESA